MPQKHAKNNCASKCFNHWERNEASSEGHYGTRKARIGESTTHSTGLGEWRGGLGGGNHVKDGRQMEAIPLYPRTAVFSNRSVGVGVYLRVPGIS